MSVVGVATVMELFRLLLVVYEAVPNDMDLLRKAKLY
jgi:hypothetical protein